MLPYLSLNKNLPHADVSKELKVLSMAHTLNVGYAIGQYIAP